MKTIASYRALAKTVGATVEEDSGCRESRILQIVAPDGKLWKSTGGCHLVVAMNEKGAFEDAKNRISFGLEDGDCEA